jgi:diguanylate cyclase (GGDEF)-like protein
LKAIATLIKRTTRVNDYACRTGPVEVSLVLPHCSKKGAAIRGERLRRAIESHSFSLSGVHVSVSTGISEYPTLCSTTEELDLTAAQALRYVVDKGGNKVCLFKAPDSFKPDFEVPAG